VHLPAPARILFRSIVAGVLALLLVGLPLVFVWARFAGIGFGLPERVAEALGTADIEVQIRRLAMDVAEGLIAEGVVLRSRRTGQEMAQLDRLSVSLNLAEILARKVRVERMALSGAQATIPLEVLRGGNGTLSVTGVSGQVVVEGGRWFVPHVEAVLHGVRIAGRATLDLPEHPSRLAKPGAPGQPSARQEQPWIGKFLDALDRLRFEGEVPSVSFIATGTLGEPLELEVSKLAFRCGAVAGDGWKLERVELAASFEGRVLRVERFVAEDRAGKLQAWASADAEHLEVEGHSSLDPAPFLHAAQRPEWLSSLHFSAAPDLSFRLSANPSRLRQTMLLTGRLVCPELSFRDTVFRQVGTDFAWRDGKLLLRSAHADAGGGRAEGDVLLAPGDFRLRIASTIPPSAIAPLAGEKAGRTLSLFEFRDAPGFRLTLRGPSPTFDQLAGNGSLELGATAMRGVWIDAARSQIEISNGAIRYRDLEISRDGGRATGGFTYDFKGQRVVLDRVESEIDPVSILMWVDPKIAETVSAYRFRQPPRVSANGTVFMKEIPRNDLRIEIEAGNGLNYDLLGKTLPFGKTLATVHLDGDVVRARVSRARLLGGEVRVDADVSLDRSSPTLSAAIEGSGVDFAGLTKLYFGYEGSKGMASGAYKFDALLGRESDMEGSGWVRVENGNVFAIPLLGPFSEILDKLLPGSGYETARLASADFRIAQRKVTTDNLEIEGSGFSMYGEGSVGFPRGEMDMAIRLNARGLPGIVLFPVSKLFEYVSTGSFSDPQWRPKMIPRLPPSSSPGTEP
jgi:hypothetical protein